MSQYKSQYLYKGGLAEIVSSPSDLTYSFILHWFSGSGSLGQAMKILHLPFQPLEQSLLIRMDGELYTDLLTEEALLYAQTVLSYKPLRSISDQPSLSISFKKILSLSHLLSTFKLILQQSQWIGNPQQVLKEAESFLNLIKPIPEQQLDLKTIDNQLTFNVLPYVLAIDFLHEFIQALLIQKFGKNNDQIISYIYQQIREKDWIFQSIHDQYRVKNNECSFDEYISLYGVRADDDYELTSPRWQEEAEVLKQKINQAVPPPENKIIPAPTRDTTLVKVCCELSLLRSEARKKTLPWISKLRQELINQLPVGKTLEHTTRKDFGLEEKITFPLTITPTVPSPVDVSTRKGTGVSPGIVRGTVKNIHSSSDIIPSSCIAIFPNASPMYASLYARCAGIIFLSGGRTSHGVIVSREYGIPAIIAARITIADNTNIELNGSEGTWQYI